MDILYEDNHIIVVSKPQGVASQPDETGDNDMLTQLKAYVKEKYNKPGEAWVGVVHRLDRPTGGVLVYAKTSKAAARLSEQLKNGEFDKTYLAVVCGKPREQKGKIVSYLKKDEKTNTAVIVPQSTTGAKRAELDYEVLEYNKETNRSLVKVKLYSGRGHQIRVQMKSIKCPVYGDQKYGGEGMDKVMLNLFAAELSFYHPTTKQKLVFRVYPPETESAWNEFNLEKYLSLRTNYDD
ncbi:MAG: RluA family pseudouridine synthase [Clostridia bacterium]|nr:RluA family pseudouridine synthase [Clostridia bacterium]